MDEKMVSVTFIAVLQRLHQKRGLNLFARPVTAIPTEMTAIAFGWKAV